jgi:Mrp family chromosome partitioning ATPase
MNMDDAFRNLLTHFEAQRVRSDSPSTVFEEIPPEEAQGEEPAGGTGDAMPISDLEEGLDTVEETVDEPAEENEAATAVLAARALSLDDAHVLDGFGCSVMEEDSSIAEEYRLLLARIRNVNPEAPSVMLTSCRQNEGVTSTALNLALSAAQSEAGKTLLLDLNFRKPDLLARMQAPIQPDLLDVLRGGCPPEQALRYSRADNLYLLAPARSRANPVPVLRSGELTDLMARLHVTFDLVIIDSPPCLTMADSLIVGGLAGGAVLVVRAHETQREAVASAALALREQGIEVLGMALTFMQRFVPRCLDPYEYSEDLAPA